MSRVTAPELILKQPNEKIRCSIDFAALLAEDETISNPVVTSEKKDGSASDLDITGVTVSGSSVLMWIAEGTDSTTYRVEVVVDSSGGSIFEGDGLLKVKDK